MRPFSEHTHFAGFDWASDHHDVVVVDRQGIVAAQMRFDDTASGWSSFRERLQPFPALAVAIETSSGPTVDRLLDAGYTVYPVQPKAAKSYRVRMAPSGSKDDLLDARSLSDALRTDGHKWRALRPEDPLTLELRLLCRDEQALIEERTAKILQLQSALHDYFPAALEAFDDWALPSAWAFIEQFPTPAVLQAAGTKKWRNFLHAHRLARPDAYARRMEIFGRASQFTGSQPSIAAKSVLAVTLARLLTTLEARLKFYRERIQELYDKHPDKDWFGTLPIAQDGKTAPRLLAELGTDRERFDDAQALQCVAGTAPVRYQSGQIEKVYFRRACNKHFRFAIHWFAELSRKHCPWAAAYYQKKRDERKTHACVLRNLGHRWLKIIFQMWKTRTPYNPELHQQNQLKHGSWVLKLLPETASSTQP